MTTTTTTTINNIIRRKNTYSNNSSLYQLIRDKLIRFIDNMDFLYLYILIDRIYNFPVLGVATNGEKLILGSKTLM